MSEFKPSFGAPARGNAFYPRKREVDKIFDLLECNTNIYLSAPRRVGKTSILKHLEDTDNDTGYYFIYVVTESIYSVNDFFKTLYNELVLSNAIARLAKLSKALQNIITTVVTNVDVKGIKVKEQGEPDYYHMFLDLLSKIDRGIGRVVIMIDEFPQTLHNIHKQHGDMEARRFLQLNRELRHHKATEAAVSFIYTGSIALFPTVAKIGSLNDVNDLETVEVKPLSRADAKELLRLLCERRRVIVEAPAIEFMLDEIRCFIPFHIQLVYLELEDIHYDKGEELDADDVRTAIERTVEAKNKARFEPYFARLKKLLDVNEYAFAMQVLVYTAHHNSIDLAIIFDLSQKYAVAQYDEILEMLCEDGYFFETGKTYIYTSPILQLWCKKNNNYAI